MDSLDLLYHTTYQKEVDEVWDHASVGANRKTIPQIGEVILIFC